ncbi:MAG: HAD-IA family hydrolase [Candidatus Omnitrophota bacterium]
MKTYSLLIFDFDGTLVDTLPDIAHYANDILSRYGYHGRPIEEVESVIGWGVHELFTGLIPELAGRRQTLDEMVAAFKEDYTKDPVRSTKAFGGVVEMLEGPLGHVRKAIVTNKPEAMTRRILERLDLTRHFERIIGQTEGGPLKPDPESTLAVIREAAVSPARTVFIGDSMVDRRTAKNAGIDFVWMSHGYDNSPAGLPGIHCMDSARQWSLLVEPE